MKTFREFVEHIELINENPVLRAALGGAMMSGFPKGVVDTLKLMNRLPVKAPAIRAPLPTPKAAPVPTIKRASNPIAATLQALTNLQGSTPQSGPAAERAKANRETQIQQRYGDAMNKTPSRFGKAGPDVPETPAASPEQGVGTKPRVAAPYTPPRPAAEPKVEPKVEPKPKPIPRADKPRVDPFAPVGITRSVTTERPTVSRSGAPITSAQAIARGSTEGQGKSAVSTYRDKTDTKGLSVGRYKTLAQHRAAVEAQKNKK
jgi:hypothetical protein